MQLSEHPWGRAATPYDAIGGDAAVRALVERFYNRVDGSAPTLRAMLPANDAVSRQKLYEFLSGWLGGPPLYIEKRGHPRLRMRHLPFAIGEDEVVDWLRCMGEAMDESGIDGELRIFLEEQFGLSAHHLRNR
jgi:hemoglobin